MLPKSKDYLVEAGFSPMAASYMLIGLFLAGVFGIQLLSSLLHRFMPSHVVDCDHTHDEEDDGEEQDEMEEHHDEHEHNYSNGIPAVNFKAPTDDEETPLLSRMTSISPPKQRTSSAPPQEASDRQSDHSFKTAPSSRRPSYMPRSLTRTFTKLTAPRRPCDETGPCKGFSDPCGQDCFKGVNRRASITTGVLSRQSTFRGFPDMRNVPSMPERNEHGSESHSPDGNGRSRSTGNGHAVPPGPRSRSATHHYHHPPHEHGDPVKQDGRESVKSHSVGNEHHHHVPTNAFMAIGLQTSIAIALHKAPEGFITYATNHANPTLGFAVFMALFIHNITEGFALALPLYLALGSRLKAMFWAAVLGGLSQPIGAGVAALWFKLAKDHSSFGEPDKGIYGGMFAVTAGVMTSVALTLFSESLSLSHNKHICIGFAFLGMGILGVSFALTA